MNNQVFFCKRCNECCKGEGGINFEEDQIIASAYSLGIEPTDFIKRYCYQKDYQKDTIIYSVRCAENGFCSLLGFEGCLVHINKPVICQRWPFFTALLRDSSIFIEAKLICPGINPNANHDDFIVQARQEGYF